MRSVILKRRRMSQQSLLSHTYLLPVCHLLADGTARLYKRRHILLLHFVSVGKLGWMFSSPSCDAEYSAARVYDFECFTVDIIVSITL